MFDIDKKYGILGLARSGIAAAYKIKTLGGKAFLSEIRKKEAIEMSDRLIQDFDCEFGGHSEKLFTCNEWVVSPGIPLSSEVIQKGRNRSIKMISELELGYQVKANDSRVIAVTGSNGKSTTASLIAYIIQQSGYKCILAGNIGNALCGFEIEKNGIDYIVLEVSSFQLDLIDQFRPNVAILLNVTPDHLDRYESFQDYTMSKFKIFLNQTENDYAVLNFDDFISRQHLNLVKSNMHFFTLEQEHKTQKRISAWLEDRMIFFEKGNFVINIDDLNLKGPHNWSNTMAAIISCSCIGIDNETIMQGVSNFKPLNHRLQYVRTIRGVSFYNDSKATNCDSVKYALLSFNKPIRVIMGGSDKGEDFGVLTDLLHDRTKKVYVTGNTSSKMYDSWYGKVTLSVIDDFNQCIQTALDESEEGDIIVLTPACASFDKFRNFEHRGDTFIQIVNELADAYEKN